MELKDYLHLYKNCEIKGRGRLTYVNNLDFQNMLARGEYSFGYDEIKPILRPLSDMTEEEVQELWNVLGLNPDFESEDYPEMTKTKYISEYFNRREVFGGHYERFDFKQSCVLIAFLLFA